MRTVHLDIKEHPEAITPSVAGHSIGWWEDNTLVVDTVGFAPNGYSPLSEIMHSDQMHVSERLSLTDDGKQLVRTYEATDAEYFETPYTGSSTYLRSELPMVDYNCVELSGVSKIRPEDD